MSILIYLFSVFDWNNKQNGMLIGSIGIVSALLQGGYVRRATSKIGEGVMARRGVFSCALGLVFLSILPIYVSTNLTLAHRLLQLGALCMAFTSSTVVNSLTAFASLQCDEGGFDPTTGKPAKTHPLLAKGKALGKFRSSGQLGRAVGPLIGPSFLRHAFLFTNDRYSLCIILDSRSHLHIRNWCCSYVCFINAHEKNSRKMNVICMG